MYVGVIDVFGSGQFFRLNMYCLWVGLHDCEAIVQGAIWKINK